MKSDIIQWNERQCTYKNSSIMLLGGSREDHTMCRCVRLCLVYMYICCYWCPLLVSFFIVDICRLILCKYLIMEVSLCVLLIRNGLWNATQTMAFIASCWTNKQNWNTMMDATTYSYCFHVQEHQVTLSTWCVRSLCNQCPQKRFDDCMIYLYVGQWEK